MTDKHEIGRLEQAKADYYESEKRRSEWYLKEQIDEDNYTDYFFFAEVDPGSVAKVAVSMNRQFHGNPEREFNIIFNSPGGLVHSGLALYDFLGDLRKKGAFVRTKVYGVAASIAAVLTQSGDERVMSPNSFLMLHEVKTFGLPASTARDFEEHKQHMERFEDRALDILCERSKLTKARIKRRWKASEKDWYLGAEEALKEGLIDRIE